MFGFLLVLTALALRYASTFYAVRASAVGPRRACAWEPALQIVPQWVTDLIWRGPRWLSDFVSFVSLRLDALGEQGCDLLGEAAEVGWEIPMLVLREVAATVLAVVLAVVLPRSVAIAVFGLLAIGGCNALMNNIRALQAGKLKQRALARAVAARGQEGGEKPPPVTLEANVVRGKVAPGGE